MPMLIFSRFQFSCLSCGTARTLGCARLEAVLEFTCDELQRSHTASAGDLSPLGLFAPVVCTMGQYEVRFVLWQRREGMWRLAGDGRRRYAHFLTDALGYPQFAQVCFWTWRDRRPGDGESVWDRGSISNAPCLHTAAPTQDVGLVVALAEAGRSFRCANCQCRSVCR